MSEMRAIHREQQEVFDYQNQKEELEEELLKGWCCGEKERWLENY